MATSQQLRDIALAEAEYALGSFEFYGLVEQYGDELTPEEITMVHRMIITSTINLGDHPTP